MVNPNTARHQKYSRCSMSLCLKYVCWAWVSKWQWWLRAGHLKLPETWLETAWQLSCSARQVFLSTPTRNFAVWVSGVVHLGAFRETCSKSLGFPGSCQEPDPPSPTSRIQACPYPSFRYLFPLLLSLTAMVVKKAQKKSGEKKKKVFYQSLTLWSYFWSLSNNAGNWDMSFCLIQFSFYYVGFI